LLRGKEDDIGKEGRRRPFGRGDVLLVKRKGGCFWEGREEDDIGKEGRRILLGRRGGGCYWEGEEEDAIEGRRMSLGRRGGGCHWEGEGKCHWEGGEEDDIGKEGRRMGLHSFASTLLSP
jgi:hypothetical protein